MEKISRDKLIEMMKEKYGESRKVYEKDFAFDFFVSIPGNVSKEERKDICYCPECKKAVSITQIFESDDRRFESLYECDACGCVNSKITLRDYDRFPERNADGKVIGVAFFIPDKIESFISEKNNRASRLVNRLHFSKLVAYYDSNYTDIKKVPMLSVVNVDGISGKVTQKTIDENGNVIADTYVSSKLNPDVSLTRFEARDRLDSFMSIGNVFHPLSSNNNNFDRIRILSEGIDFTDDKSFDSFYNVWADKYGLNIDPTVDIKEKRAICMLLTLYPAVCERELGEINTNIDFARQRGDVISDVDAAKQRTDKLLDVRSKLALIDYNIASDLAKMQNAEQVTSYLRSIVFGEKPKVKLPGVKIDVTKSAMLDDGYGGKNLKKAFNKDPYGTASNVRTARKIGAVDVNHVNLLFSILDDETNISHRNGVIYPIEKKHELRFIRLMKKSRDIGRVINDVYINNNVSRFQDCASMYDDLMKRGVKIAGSKEEAAMVGYMDFLHKYEQSISSAEQRAAFVGRENAPDFGEHTEAILADMAGRIEGYKESGLWNELWKAPRNQKALFARDLGELHDELIFLLNRNQSAGDFNYYYEWPSEIKERVERDYGEYKFHMPKDSNELVRVGRDLSICIGGSNYDRMCRNLSCCIALMTDKNDEYVAAIEADPDFKNLYQFKAYKDQALYGEAVLYARKWMDELDLKGCMDTDAFDENRQRREGGRGYEDTRAIIRPDATTVYSLKDMTLGAECADRLAEERLQKKSASKNISLEL